MLERLFVEQAAPTLAGIKPGSLFSCSAEDFCRGVRLSDWNARMESKGILARALGRCGQGRVLVYVYRPRQLERLLAEGAVASFLAKNGYEAPGDPEACLRHLTRRILAGGGFPHEIGIFLGYPLEDVEGFIRHQGRNCALCGTWKVYGDVARAQKHFARFTHCTHVYKRLFEEGTPLTRLTVPVF